MDISVLGIGWVGREAYGCVRQGMSIPYNKDGEDGIANLHRKGIFSYAFKNLGRLDNASKMTCSAVALALKDAGIEYSMNQKQDMGIIGTSRSGSLKSDSDYFKDYIKCGRTLARGNLFIYTLPSSPLGEAAIHFGLQGPLLYTASPAKSLQRALKIAGEMIISGEVSTMLGGVTEEDEAVYFVLAKKSARTALCGLADAMAVLEKDMIFSETIKQLFAGADLQPAP